MSRSPTLQEVILGAVEHGLANLHVALPGIVQSFDPDALTANIKPAIKLAHTDTSGNKVYEEVPIIVNCPVHFARGGGFSLTHPLSPGDTGILLFQDASIGEYFHKYQARVVTPTVDHSHNLSDAVFIPGFSPKASSTTMPPVFGGAVALGKIGQPHTGVAVGSVLDSYLSALHTWLTGLAAAASYLTPQPGAPTTESGTVLVTG
jgi:hypothetical protein